MWWGTGSAVKLWKPAPTIHRRVGCGAGLPRSDDLPVIARRYLCDGAWWIGARKTRPPSRRCRWGEGQVYAPLTPSHRQLTYAVGAGSADQTVETCPYEGGML